MTDKATETEKEISKGKPNLLEDIRRRQNDGEGRDYLFTIVVVVGLIVIVVLAIAAAQYL